MIRNSNTWKRLERLQPFTMMVKDLTPQSKEKVKDTTRYSLRKDPSQDEREVLRRCTIATLAEQYVAQEALGWVLGGEEDYDNPYSFAYDVVSREGVRIEVKTHQSKAKWISVHTGAEGDYPNGYGINLGPFLDHRLADMMVMLDTKEINGGIYQFTPKFLAGVKAFHPDSGFVQKSQGEGWYLRSCSDGYPYYRFTR